MCDWAFFLWSCSYEADGQAIPDPPEIASSCQSRCVRLISLRLFRVRAGSGNDQSDIAITEDAVEGRKIVLQKLLEFRGGPSHLSLDRAESVQLRIGGWEIRAAGDVAAAGADFGIEPNQVEIGVVRLDKVFVIAVDERRGDQLVF